MARQEDTSRLQERAWGFYGFPGSSDRAVGEVRYVVGWLADQMTRLEWDVLIDGSEEWKVDLPAEGDKPAESITTTGEDGEQDLTAASMKLLELVGWTEANVKAITTNLFVGGQGDYIRQGSKWRVVSVIENDRKKTLAEANDDVPFMWPHPADPKKPDAPLFAVLDVLDDLQWLARQARTQSKQRSLTSGYLLVADGFQGPNGTDVWEQFNAASSARMANEDDLSPIRFQGPHDLVKDGVNWIKPDLDYDAVIDRRILADIERLGYGLPIPKEILLGMQAASRATAFQIEDNGYRAHIEPPATLVGQVGQDALTLILDDRVVEVRPNPSQMLARKQSVEDVKWAREQGLVDPEYTREVLGIPEDAAPEEDDGVPISGPTVVEKDPANVAADEPIAAAGSTPTLSDLLAEIDSRLSYELAGVTVMATDRARQRLGGAARVNPDVRAEHKSLNNAQLASQLGVDGLTAAGVKVAEQIEEPIDAAAKWWVRRIGEAWEQTSTLVPGWAGQGDWVTESVDKLAEGLTSHIMGTLGAGDAPPLDAGAIRAVLDAAAGGGV